MAENAARRSERKRSRLLRSQDEFHHEFHDDGEQKHLRKKEKVDTNFYECKIVEVDAANSRVKINFVGYPDEDDQCRPFTEENFPLVKKMPRFDYRSETVDERANDLKATIFPEVKKHLLATRKADPEVRIELPTQSDAYEDVLSKLGLSLEAGMEKSRKKLEMH